MPTPHTITETEARTERRQSAPERRLLELAAVQRRLNGASSMPELFRGACEAASDWCRFSRSLVVSVEYDHLSADVLGAMSDPASDALRRQMLSAPVALRPGSL